MKEKNCINEKPAGNAKQTENGEAEADKGEKVKSTVIELDGKYFGCNYCFVIVLSTFYFWLVKLDVGCYVITQVV